MPMFRKKPVVIEAIQFTDNADELVAWANGDIEHTRHATVLNIRSMEGDVRAHVGDWIIKGVEDEFYPCNPSVFDQTYEPA